MIMAEFVMDRDLIYLQSENESLHEEIAQLQADKEFVWSLWKRLQVASPDLTQAIAEVVQREKQKAEVKDAKVLQILKVKDDRLEELEREMVERNVDNTKLSRLEEECKDRIHTLTLDKEQLQDRLDFQEEQLRSKDNKEKTVGDLHRNFIENFERDKAEISRQSSEQKAENSVLRAENADLNAVRIVHESKIKSLQTDMIEQTGKYEKLFRDFETARKQVYEHDVEMKQLELKLDYSQSEIKSLKHELDEVWRTHSETKSHSVEQASVINQLQNLLKQTQTSIQVSTKNKCSELHQFENNYKDMEEKMIRIEEEYKNEVESLKRSIVEKKETIERLVKEERNRQIQTDIDDASTQVTSPVLKYEYRIEKLETECDLMRNRLKDKNSLIKTLQKNTNDLDLTPVRLSPKVTTKNSLKDAQLHNKLELLQKRYRNVSEQLKLKAKENDELRQSHSKRLERLKALQKNYENLKEELQNYEMDPRKVTKSKRCEAKHMRHEDPSDSVWNELTFYKHENRALLEERLTLCEDLDVFKVESIQKDATTQELEIRLESLQDRLDNALMERDRLMDPEVHTNTIDSKLRVKDLKIQNMNKEKRELQSVNELLEFERRKCKSEANDCNIELAQKRIEICDLKSQLAKLRRLIKKHSRGRVVNCPAKREILADQLSETDDGADVWVDEDKSLVQMTSESEVASLGDEIVRLASGERSENYVVKRREKRPSGKRHRRLVFVNGGRCESIGTRDVATSPPRYMDRVRGSMNKVLKQQLKIVKLRLVDITEQVKGARQAKNQAEKTCQEQIQMIEQLQKDLSSANQRLKSTRENLQKLQADNQKLLAERAVLGGKAAGTNAVMLLDDGSVTSSLRETDEKKFLESRLRVSANEVTRQSAEIKSLRESIDQTDLKVTELSEKVQRMERDVGQKRLLLEDTRLRLKISEEQRQTSKTAIDELNTEIRALNDNVMKMKVKVDSADTRVGVAMKERKQYEELYHKSTLKIEDLKVEIERAGKCVSEYKNKCNVLERAVKVHKVKSSDLENELNEIEVAASEQMKQTVRKSEKAIEMIQRKFEKVQRRLVVYRRFTDSFSQRLLHAVSSSRRMVNMATGDKRSDTSRESLRRAGHVAKTILNIDDDELNDLMNIDLQVTSDQRFDKDDLWREKLQVLVKDEGDFSGQLTDYFMEKIDEQVKLLSDAILANP